MVQYWKNGDVARAKLMTINGAYAMQIEGEKYPLWGFPRGPVLFGPLMRLKKLSKDLVFNKTWELLDQGIPDKDVVGYVKNFALSEVIKEVEKSKYDFFPEFRMCPAVKELHRALGRVGMNDLLKEGICFFFQEDDAYRFRLQWLAGFINPKAWWRRIYYFITRKEYSLKSEIDSLFKMLAYAEITPDMRGRAKLVHRIVRLMLEDEEFGELIEKAVKEIDWRKMKLSRADSYYFRGKYFKVDYAKFDY